MSWFQSANIASFAKTALKEAQKTIDKALDIKEEDGQGSAPNVEGGESGRNAGVTAVTDMASDFFASWGVTTTSSTSKRASGSAGTTSTNTSSNSNSSSNNGSPMKHRAISTPPKKSSSMKVQGLLSSSVEEDKHQHNYNYNSFSNSSSDHNHISGSDVPVTLLASSDNDNEISTNCTDKIVDSSTSSKVKQHTRSLSDTVFHASDDTNSNLLGLVQVLDDSTVVLDPDPINYSSTTHTSSLLSHSQSPSHQNRIIPEAKSDSKKIIVASQSQSFVESEVEEALITKNIVNTIPSVKESVPSNVELLQEIDLDGSLNNFSDQITSVPAPEENDVITSPLVNLNDVEASGLSDGWDWAVSTDSCYDPVTLVDLKREDDIPEHEEPGPEHVEVEENPENSEQEPETDPVVGDLLGTSEETLKLEQEQVVDLEKTEPNLNEESTNTVVALADEDSVQVQLKTDKDQEEEEQEHASPSQSSRPSSPVEQENEPDVVVGVGDSTPPSSARVSPNFEMVSCVVSSSGGTLPESSRSSSIVVVSGRGSTPNSRGTSGAGSSGSSEGGHDLVDGEMPQSPAATACSLQTGQEFLRKSKHKKGASSSSSSDIEVIPSDYSSSSAVPNQLPSVEVGTELSKLKDKPPCSDKECQTELELVSTSVQLQYADCQVQTEEESDTANSSAVPPTQDDISQFVSNEVADILLEKEQMVQQLREEGEKLSMKQFELSQVIKKLRAKEKETETMVKGLRTEMATKNLELERIMKTFITKEGIEQSQNETISRLNQERRKLELKVEELSSELEDARDNVDSMKATVENASIEILELKNVISSVQRESAEVDRLTKDKAELISRTDSLQKEVDHLRSVLNSSQISHHSRESELKSQISTLTHKAHQLETRLADISSEVADATMPLSMEIQKLQNELKQQVSQSDRREQVMQSTITDLEIKLRSATEKEKSAKDLQIHYQSQHSTLELRIEELEAKNRGLLEQLQQKEDIFGKKLEDKNARCQKLEKTVERLTGEVERLSGENDSLSNELKAERTTLEMERRRSSHQQNFVMDSNNPGRDSNFQQSQSRVLHQHHHHHHPTQPHHQRSSSMSTTISSSSGMGSRGGTIRNDNSPRSREHSPSEHSITSEEASYLDEVFDPNTGMMIGGPNNGNRSMTPKSFFESFSSAGLIENLQSQLRIRESEVIAFQEELSKNEKIRKQLNEEIANLTMQNQQLGLEMEKLTEMEQKLEEVNKSYNAVLQMYGEKVEEADELRMDLEDVKEMYKTQIEQLLKKT